MASKYISINDAAELTGKSPQTIRRLIKAKKVKFRKIKTPQGFNYDINRESIMEFYDIDAEATVETQAVQEEAKAAPAQKQEVTKDEANTIKQLLDSRSHKVLVEYAPVKEFNNTLQVLLKQHSKEKENLFKLVEAFQNKVVTLETKLKASEDQNRKWYKFW